MDHICVAIVAIAIPIGIAGLTLIARELGKVTQMVRFGTEDWARDWVEYQEKEEESDERANK